MKEKKVRVTVKKGGQQTIKKQIEQMVMLLLAISLTLVGIISCILNYTSTVSIVKESMKTTAQVAAEGVRYRLKATMNLVEIIGTVPRLSDGTVSNEEKKTLINDYLKEYNWKSTNLVGTDGISVLDDLNISDRKYFGKAVSGETAISEPVLSKETGELVITVAAPVWKDGNQGSEVVGVVVVAIDANQLSDVVRAINISKNGSAYIIDEQGNTVAHPDLELVRNSSNTIEDSAKDASLKTIAKMEQKMIAGETGVGNYRYGGTSKYMGYAPVGLNGWSLAVTAPSGDFMSGTVTSIIIIVALLIAALLIGVFLARRFGETIGGAIRKCAERLELLAQGDLSTEVPQVDSKNETKTLVDSTVRIVDTQQKVIHDLNYLLSEMADGNFAIRTQIGEEAYIGEYHQLLLSIRKQNTKLSDTLRSISEASDQVEAGSNQLAEGAQELAEGATEQAGAVQELLATVNDVTRQVEENNRATDEAYTKAEQVGNEASNSQEKMTELTAAMERIENTSNEIKNIIAGIEDIASQTNLLSLNASIEAARAGEAGRGFAVVADQIGKLAEQSAQSAVNTRELIESSIHEVNTGSRITNETAEAMTQVIEGLTEISSSITQVRNASEQQTAAIEQIEQGVEQISGVVQSNSASAEESSAASEELSAQVQSLNQLTSQFTLR